MIFKFNKGQFWYLDLVLAVIIFVSAMLTFIAYNSYTTPNNNLRILRDDSEKISDLILTKGLPFYWNLSNVQIPGIIDNNKINPVKIKNLYEINQDKIKALLGINSNFELYVLVNNEIYSFGNKCGINVSGNISNNSILEYFDINTSFNNGNLSRYEIGEKNNDLKNFSEEINKHKIGILIEPDFIKESTSTIQEKEFIKNIQNFVYNGGIIIVFGKINSDFNFLEINFTTINPKLEKTIIVNDLSLDLKDYNAELENDIKLTGTFKNKFEDEHDVSYRYLVNSNISDFIVISENIINNTNEYTSFKLDYGLGQFYYFPNIKDEEVLEKIKELIYAMNTGTCKLNLKTYDDLIQTSRLTFYNKQIARVIIRTYK